VKKWITICLLAMTNMAFAKSADSTTFQSVRAVHGVALETNPYSAFWQGAVPVYLEVDKWGKPIASDRTEVRSRWTKNNLYFLFTCPYQKLNLKPNPHMKTETNQLWNWDVAEVFIGSDFHNIRHYKEFEISPQGEWVDLDINLNASNHDWQWNSGFQVVARIDHKKKIWYGAMRIPIGAVDPHAAQVGSTFRINLFRTEGVAPDTKMNVWQPTMSDTFHVPERFGLLKLVDSK
jgi:hypothetical protein